MIDRSHLNALRTRLSNESVRLDKAASYGEYLSRLSIVLGIEKEIAGLGIKERVDGAMSDDELLAALEA